MAKRRIVNGKQTLWPDEVATVKDARRYLGPAVGQDQFLQVSGRGVKVLAEDASLPEGVNLVTVPPIVKGAGARVGAGPHPVPAVAPRILEEVTHLQQTLGQRYPVEVGPKTVGGTRYTGVIVKNVSTSIRKFGVTRTDMLFMLPPGYPALPPVGFYVNYKWPTADHHFLLRTAHGAVDLQGEGWYWYCVAIGGFDAGLRRGHWLPAAAAQQGHNLLTLFVAAQYALNSSD